MSHPAFLRAITSEPADDTARLVYADFLEETGEPVHVARAEFIRTQIQAHTLHPNHPRRAELQTRAAELFAANWVEWWSPVCEATGLPLLYTGSPSLRERVARFFGRKESRGGHLYRPAPRTTLAVVQPRAPAPQTTLRAITFERGFPQSISLLGQLRDVREAIHAWTTAAPLTALHLHGTVGREWRLIDGEHLRGVRELMLDSSAATAVTAIAESRHLSRLEELSLHPDRSNIAWPAEQYRAYTASSLATRVRRLNVVIGRMEEAEALNGPHLANLVALTLHQLPYDEDDGVVAGGMVLVMAHSHMNGLRELSITGVATLAAGGLPNWLAGQLRRLVIGGIVAPGMLCECIRRDQFTALTDLSVSSRSIEAVYAALAESPLAGRLYHLRLLGGETTRPDARVELLRLVNALDPEKLETLALDRGVRDVPGLWDELQERFPGRVSLV